MRKGIKYKNFGKQLDMAVDKREERSHLKGGWGKKKREMTQEKGYTIKNKLKQGRRYMKKQTRKKRKCISFQPLEMNEEKERSLTIVLKF